MSDIKGSIKELAGLLKEETGEMVRNKKMAEEGRLPRNTGRLANGKLPKLDGPHMH